MEIRYCYGDYYEPEYGADAFEQSLKEMKGKYSAEAGVEDANEYIASHKELF